MSISRIVSSFTPRPPEVTKSLEAKTAQKETNEPESVSIDISPERLSELSAETASFVGDVRLKAERKEKEVRSQEIKERIASGFYESPEVIDKIIEGYLKEYVLSV